MKIFGYKINVCASLNLSMLMVSSYTLYMNIVIDLAYTLQTFILCLNVLCFRFP